MWVDDGSREWSTSGVFQNARLRSGDGQFDSEIDAAVGKTDCTTMLKLVPFVAQPEQAVLRSNKKLITARSLPRPRCQIDQSCAQASCAFGALPLRGSATLKCTQVQLIPEGQFGKLPGKEELAA